MLNNVVKAMVVYCLFVFSVESQTYIGLDRQYEECEEY